MVQTPKIPKITKNYHINNNGICVTLKPIYFRTHLEINHQYRGKTLVKTIAWAQYLETKVNQQSYAISMAQCRDALAGQREMIGHLVNVLGSRSIVCLGAGFLNDLPVSMLFSPETRVTLVDWIDGISQEGLANQIIHKLNDQYHCLFCDKNIGKLYCKSFTNELLSEGVCTAFMPVDEPNLTCQSYQSNIEPKFLRCDITAGYGHQFAETIQKKMRNCKTPKEAFITAIRLCNRLESKIKPIPLDDDSIDLVTSSMVLSQFDNEPYSFFALLLEQHFGRAQVLAHEDILRPLMEQLRTKLFLEQVRRHLREIYRMVRKDGPGRVYLSVELFRSSALDGLYFLVQDIPKAMDVINEYFLFDLEKIPEKKIFNSVEIDCETSIIQNYVLVPRVH